MRSLGCRVRGLLEEQLKHSIGRLWEGGFGGVGVYGGVCGGGGGGGWGSGGLEA